MSKKPLTKEQLRKQELENQFRHFAKKNKMGCQRKVGTIAHKHGWKYARDIVDRDYGYLFAVSIDIKGRVTACADRYDEFYVIAEGSKDYVDEAGWQSALDAANAFIAKSGGKWQLNNGSLEDPQVPAPSEAQS